MMSRWTHRCCKPCWMHVLGRTWPPPHVVLEDEAGPCCWCGEDTSTGIYLRQDPIKMRCQGAHGDQGIIP